MEKYNPNTPYPPASAPGYPPPYPPESQGPPIGYSYPPVPVPYHPDQGHHAMPQPGGPGGDGPTNHQYTYPPVPVPAIMHQPGPGQGGYGPPPYGSSGYPQPQQYGQPQGYSESRKGFGEPPQQYNSQHPPNIPIQMQPTSGFSPHGQTVPLNVPPGLEFLTQLDRLYIKQKVELLEAFLGCETKNKYKIRDSQGRELYTAKEDTDCCTRNCCGPLRPFDLKIKDLSDREIIHLTRPLACDSCWCPCWLQSLDVFSPPGQFVGRIEQEWSICVPKFVIKDAQDEVVLRIEGPFCTFSFCGDVEFQILSKDGSTQVGKISKKWSGLLREAFTDADNFGINFPMDLDVRMKAVMLGACFLIDFMFFEKTQNKENDSIGMF